MNIIHDLGVSAPIWMVALGACLVLLLTVTGGTKKLAPSVGTHLALASLAFLVTSAWLLFFTKNAPTAFSGAVIVDGVGILFGLSAILAACVATVYATGYLNEHQLSHGEYLALVLLSTVGMLVLAMAGDLLTMYIGIEIMSLAVYVLAGYKRSCKLAQEAALKYFVYGAFASGFGLFGMALVYGEVGRIVGVPALNFMALAKSYGVHPVSALGWIGAAFVLGSLFFKIAAVPFHMWAPDVYEGSPTVSTGFMAVGIKAAAFAGLCRFSAAIFLHGERSTETAVLALEILAIVTMILGNILAIRQTQIKRMLAYSSIAHAGYIMVGLCALIAAPQGQALEAVSYYVLGYTVMTLGAFGVVLFFEHRDERRVAFPIERLAGMAHKYPALGMAMAIFMFSLAGLPPTAGFFGKLSVFAAALEAGRLGLVLVAVLASIVGAYYYLRVTVVMYMRAKHTEERAVQSHWLSVGLWICVAGTLLIGIFPESYWAFAQKLLEGWIG